MKILVTNDDGVNAEGLWTLVDWLKDAGDVTVIAPDREQSGVGTSITFHHPIRITQVHEKIHGIETHAVEGTPADCVIMAIKVVMKDGIDLVVSGVNQGPNCGYDVFLSGTVGAALQGFFYSIPSVAVSVNGFAQPKFETGARVARAIADYVKEKGIKGKMLLNVNVPDLDLRDIPGMDVTKLGEKVYSAGIETGYDGRHEYYWIQHRAVDMEDVSGTDLWALKHRRISVTPLRFNRKEYSTEFVHELVPAVCRRLLGNK